jgi:hypothetical protein
MAAQLLTDEQNIAYHLFNRGAGPQIDIEKRSDKNVRNQRHSEKDLGPHRDPSFLSDTRILVHECPEMNPILSHFLAKEKWRRLIISGHYRGNIGIALRACYEKNRILT